MNTRPDPDLSPTVSKKELHRAEKRLLRMAMPVHTLRPHEVIAAEVHTKAMALSQQLGHDYQQVRDHLLDLVGKNPQSTQYVADARKVLDMQAATAPAPYLSRAERRRYVRENKSYIRDQKGTLTIYQPTPDSWVSP